jgi:monoamine oxidase
MRMLGLVDDGVAHAETPHLTPGSGAGRSVLILGAGLAGLSAAHELKKAGYAVRVLEARDRVGGRSWTVRNGDRVAHIDGPDQTCAFDEGLYFNAGPGRIPSHHQATLGYCRELGVPMEVLVNHSLSTRIQSETLNGGKPLQMREAAYGVRGHVASLLAKAVRNGGVDTALTGADAEQLVERLIGWGGLDADLAFSHAERLGFEIEPAAGAVAGKPRDALTLAALMHPLAWGAPGFTDAMDMQATMLQPVGGMDRIPMAFADRLGDAIRLNAEVTRLGRAGAGVEVVWRDRTTGETQAVQADHCICTLPFPVLKDIDNDFPTAKKAAIARTDNGDAFKIAYQSPRFWEAEAQIYGGLSFTDRDTFMTWYPSNGFHQPTGVLVAGYSFGRGAGGMGARSLAERDVYARGSVERLHPGHGASLSHPVSVSWANVPFSKGIAADIARSDAEAYTLMTEAEGPYVFAGEHLSHVGAWQQGAFVSAWRAVNQIAEHRRAMAA